MISTTCATVDLAWAAGIIDGEGCVRLERRVQGVNPTFILTVIVANTDPRIVTRLAEIFGLGTIHGRKYSNPRNRPSFAWKVSSRQAEHVLRLVAPYLVSKREQAEVGLLSRGLMGPAPANVKHANIQTLERMVTDLSAMKKEIRPL